MYPYGALDIAVNVFLLFIHLPLKVNLFNILEEFSDQKTIRQILITGTPGLIILKKCSTKKRLVTPACQALGRWAEEGLRDFLTYPM